MNLRRAAVLKLGSHAQELDVRVLRGRMTRGPDGAWLVDGAPLDKWLREYEGHEVQLIAATLDDERDLETRTCNRCGREYVGAECPHCQETRRRLRPNW